MSTRVFLCDGCGSVVPHWKLSPCVSCGMVLCQKCEESAEHKDGDCADAMFLEQDDARGVGETGEDD